MYYLIEDDTNEVYLTDDFDFSSGNTLLGTYETLKKAELGLLRELNLRGE